MFLILQEIRFQDQVLKSSNLSKKQVEKYKFIKANNWLDNYIYRALESYFSPMCLTPTRQLLDSFYLWMFEETKILIYFLGIRECVFGPSFLLTLEI